MALFIPGKRVCYYFCSYALPPNREIAEYLRRCNFDKIHRSAHGFQSIGAKNCGKYCIAFCFLMSRGWSFDKFLKLLSDSENTDHFVNEFVDKIIE